MSGFKSSDEAGANNVLSFSRRDEAAVADDALTAVIRRGARELLASAVEQEVSDLIVRHGDLVDEQGRQRVVRNGFLPEREIQTGIGAVPVRVPRVRDRARSSKERIRFASNIVPPYLRRSRSVEDLLPALYLRGVSTGDFSEALTALVGPDAPGLSATTIGRLKNQWAGEHDTWSKRDLSNKRYVYMWADGIHCNVRMDDAKLCILVLIGATEDGTKELVAVEDGYRESEQSWLELLQGLKARGLEVGPKLGIGDGSLGFWKALAQVYGETRQQRCWVHKTANILNKLPKSVQSKAKAHLQEIWMAPTLEAAEKAFDRFCTTYAAKYPKAVVCLSKDRTELLALFHFPAEHWSHIRTTNPIESTFGTIRLRTAKTRGCLSRATMLSMVFKLAEKAARTWRRLNGAERMADVARDAQFIDGILVAA